MALFRKGISWTGWLIGCVVSLVFSWFGWTAPQWAEATRTNPQAGFDTNDAIEQGSIFRNHLSEERSIMMLAQSTTIQDETPVVPGGSTNKKLSQPAQSVKETQPRQAFAKMETQSPSKTQPRQAMKLEDQQNKY